MSLTSSRRGFLTGMASLFAAPAIVSAQSLMPIKVIPFDPYMLVRGRDILTNAIIDIKIYEKSDDPLSFLSVDFHDRLHEATRLMDLSHTGVVMTRDDEKSIRMLDLQQIELYQKHGPVRHEYKPIEDYVRHPWMWVDKRYV